MPDMIRDGITLHYRSEGEGDVVLMLQGVGLPSCGWLPQIPALSQHFHVIAPDNRGIGESSDFKGPVDIEDMAADALAILDHLEIEKAHLVGHSMGGIIAQQIALDAPDRARSLSLLCTTGCAKNAGRLTWRKMWMGIRNYLGTLPMRRRAFMEIILTPEQFKQEDLDALAEELKPIFGRDLAYQPAIAMRQIKALQRHDILEKLPQINHIPSLIISGKFDVVAPPTEGERLAAALDGAFECWDDAAHGLPITHKERTNARLLEHLLAA